MMQKNSRMFFIARTSVVAELRDSGKLEAPILARSDFVNVFNLCHDFLRPLRRHGMFTSTAAAMAANAVCSANNVLAKIK
jgi:hypothetical protein